MSDSRLENLARTIVDYSIAVRPGERVLIELTGLELPLAKALVRRVHASHGLAFVTIKEQELMRLLLLDATEAHMRRIAAYEAARMAEMDAYIGVRAGRNTSALADVPREKMGLYTKYWWEPVHGQIRVPKTRWCVLRYPNEAMAQQARMSLEAFEDLYFKVCGIDYASLGEAMNALAARMDAAREVHITGPGTDLRFSIEGIPSVKCTGRRNLPDGEVFTAPVRDSVEGEVTFNTPTTYMGSTFERVHLVFKGGRVVKAEARGEVERLNDILDTDEGARYVGEFSLGLNPYLLHPIGDTLFDEKIQGSFHFTPGMAYEQADNGNRSAVHWDMVCIQRPEYGGGEISFDGEVIRRDGRFVTGDLERLNPEALV